MMNKNAQIGTRITMGRYNVIKRVTPRAASAKPMDSATNPTRPQTVIPRLLQNPKFFVGYDPEVV